ncbi:NINE protein [Nostoc sphaeroides CCNUC1]|uniref:NINE protein n=2 Tax=Nostoc sphaeroides TaxID=446679 RepID=A0A5P8VVR8_9NOSO|nr:NINE protein [Nostoc sphaeroides CCNUC1]
MVICLGLICTEKIKNIFIKQVNVFALITIKTLFLYLTYQGTAQNMSNFNPTHPTKQLLAGYCGIILGGFGVHKFILGYAPEGFIMLVISVVGGSFTYGIALLIMLLVGLIEGMIYLNKPPEEFVNTYFVKKQGWF